MNTRPTLVLENARLRKTVENTAAIAVSYNNNSNNKTFTVRVFPKLAWISPLANYKKKIVRK
jgi:hypothetical protein